MEKEQNNAKTQWLTFLIYLLLTFLTAMAGWQQVQVNKLESRINLFPKEYVCLERYLTNRADVAEQLKQINLKLDRIFERVNEK